MENLVSADIVDDRLIVVIGAEAEKMKNYLNTCCSDLIETNFMEIRKNSDYKSGMMTSVKKGLENLNKSTEHIIFTLADKPMIKPAIYKEIKNEFLEKNAEILIPVYNKIKGHPVIINRKFLPQIKEITGQGGLREFFSLVPEKIYYYNCSDERIIIDIDTKEDYRSFLPEEEN
ncbi:MAG: nucleotidyltransferase family protein [Bacillota bacterium]